MIDGVVYNYDYRFGEAVNNLISFLTNANLRYRKKGSSDAGFKGFKNIKLFANNLIKKDGRLVSLTQKHIRARLADSLLLISDIYGVNPNTGILNVSLKRSDLASLSNMTTANAIRILSCFKEENLIDVNHRNIKLKNLKGLQDISAFDYR